MPPKTVKCCICGKVVSKRSTYNIGNDQRACKIHNGVLARRNSLLLAEEEKKAIEVEKTKRKERFYSPTSYQKPTCWICGHSGIRARKFYSQLLIEMKKRELVRGKPINLLDFDTWKDLKAKERVLFIVSVKENPILHKKVFCDLRQLIDMTGVAHVCADCMLELNIPHPVGKATHEQLLNASIAYKAFVEESVTERAKYELSQDN